MHQTLSKAKLNHRPRSFSSVRPLPSCDTPDNWPELLRESKRFYETGAFRSSLSLDAAMGTRLKQLTWQREHSCLLGQCCPGHTHRRSLARQRRLDPDVYNAHVRHADINRAAAAIAGSGSTATSIQGIVFWLLGSSTSSATIRYGVGGGH